MAEDDVYFDDGDDYDQEDDLEMEGEIDEIEDVESETSENEEEKISDDESDIDDDVSVFKITDIKPAKTKLNDIYKHISKYEMTRILGYRGQQIAQGSPVYVEIPEGLIDPLEIAILEYNQGKIPLLLIREYNNQRAGGTYETIHTLDGLIRFNPLY